MQILNMAKNAATIQLSFDELRFLKNAINETFEALGSDFSIRTGYTIEEARQLQANFGEALQTLRQAS